MAIPLIDDMLLNTFQYPVYENFQKAYSLLGLYGYSEIDEKIQTLFDDSTIEDPQNFTLKVIDIFTESMKEVLVNLYIVSSTENLGDTLELLDNVYNMENSLESELIVHLIDDTENPRTPKETFGYLQEHLFGKNFLDTQQQVQDVMFTFIRKLRDLHEDKLISNLEAATPELIMERRESIIKFFTLFPNTLVQGYVTNKLLQVPTDVDKGVVVISGSIYSLENHEQIAIECVALAVITPITEISVPAQARTILNKLYTDVNFVSRATLEIDKIIKKYRGSK